MSELSRIHNSLPELSEAQPQSEAWSLARISQPLVSAACVDTLSFLMAQMQARYPNQALPEGTPDMYLADWEKMVHRYGRHDGQFVERLGLDRFRAALLSLIEDRSRPRFFPDPQEIEDRLCAILREEREERERRKRDADLERRKAQWLREREEEKLHGRQYTEEELALDAKLKAAAAAKKEKAESYYGPPPLVLTPDEIKARVAAELANQNPAA